MYVSSVSSYPSLTSSATTIATTTAPSTTTSLSLLHFTAFPMRSSLSLLRSLSHSLHHHRRYYLLFPSSHKPQTLKYFASASSLRNSVEHLVDNVTPVSNKYPDPQTDFSGSELVSFDDVKHLGTPVIEVKELEELPEQWRRTKLAWLCKELPAHKSGTLVRILNAQRKWMRQEDATYVAVHCMRIRENETGFKVYKWMRQQHWYRFDFALLTKLADYLGKERKFAKCREIFDDIINQGRVPSESTFHILIVAYLSSPIPGCLDEACNIYNRMIQLGGYRPRLGLHNSLFRALVSQSGNKSKGYLKQAEFIFHNLVTCGLEIQKDIYGGLLYLHSYQESINKERIVSLREEMRAAGFEEGREVLLSLLRVCSKEGDVEEAEKIWLKLAREDSGLSSQAYIYKMELYARIEDPLKSLELFREMQQQLGSTTITSYHKIIELLCKAQKVELAESLMDEFVKSGLKQLSRSYIDMMYMYFKLGMHEKLELLFYQSFEKCPPDSTIYGIYLDSLVKVGNVDKAEEIFNNMLRDTRIVVSGRSCNSMLSAYLSSGDFVKAEKVYDLMCQRKKDVEPELMEKIDHILSLRRKTVKKPISLKLSKEQREILVGLLLGGLQIKSDEERKNHMLAFEFNESNRMHFVLKKHIFEQYHEWIHPSFKLGEDPSDMPYRFFTISHSYFGFYADQFWPQGRYTIPKLIHRWLSPYVLAYWYMYGGHRLPSGDIVLKLKGSRENVERVVKALKMKSLNCKVKRKGKVFWLGFLQNDATWFWKLIEVYVLYQLKEYPKADGEGFDDGSSSNQLINFDTGSETDEASGYSDNDRP